MAGDERDVIPQREQLVADRTHQVCVVAAWKVGAADRSLEQHVSHPGQALALVQEYHVPRCMARTVEDLQGLFTHADRIPLFQPAIRDKRRRLGHARHATPLG